MKNVSLVLVLSLTIVGCDLFTDSSDSSTALHKSITDNGMEFSVDIPTNNFSLYDTLSITFKVKNLSSSKKEFYFANIQQLTYQVIDHNNNVATYYPNIVSPALSQLSLNPGEMKVLNQNGLFKDHDGNYINRGKYLLSVFLANNNSPKLDLNISVN